MGSCFLPSLWEFNSISCTFNLPIDIFPQHANTHIKTYPIIIGIPEGLDLDLPLFCTLYPSRVYTSTFSFSLILVWASNTLKYISLIYNLTVAKFIQFVILSLFSQRMKSKSLLLQKSSRLNFLPNVCF